MAEPLSYELKRVQQALRTAADEALGAFALTTPQFVALATLDSGPGLSSAELARRCFVTPQAMNQIVLGLERRGLVARNPHPVHGRILESSLTPHGRALLVRARREVHDVDARMTAGLSGSEQEQLRELLRKCSDSLATAGTRRAAPGR